MALSPATRKFLERNRNNRQPQQFQPRFVQQTQQPNMFAKDFNNPNPMESTLGLLFGAEGEAEVGKQQLSMPSLQTSDVGDIVGSVQMEMGLFQHEPQPQQRFTRRRR